MKNWFSILLGSPKPKNQSGENLPGLGGQPIFEHIAQNIDPRTGKLTKDGKDLPDQERRYSGTRLR
jgi:hypothetical protein